MVKPTLSSAGSCRVEAGSCRSRQSCSCVPMWCARFIAYQKLPKEASVTGDSYCLSEDLSELQPLKGEIRSHAPGRESTVPAP